MKYKIFRIEEQMYGCEEPPADQPILVDVVLEGADGTRRVLPYPDEALRREVREELGVTEFTPERLTQYIFDSVRERELVYVNRTVRSSSMAASMAVRRAAVSSPLRIGMAIWFASSVSTAIFTFASGCSFV